MQWTGMDCPECGGSHCAQAYCEDDNEINWECRFCRHFWHEPIDAEKPTLTEILEKRREELCR